jgi:hypothetical protein
MLKTDFPGQSIQHRGIPVQCVHNYRTSVTNYAAEVQAENCTFPFSSMIGTQRRQKIHLKTCSHYMYWCFLVIIGNNFIQTPIPKNTAT